MKVKLTKIYTTNKDKQGNELMSKDGRPYTRMSIKTQEHGEKWLSGFEGKLTSHWKEGDEVDIKVDEVRGRDGKEYLNFKPLGFSDMLGARIDALEARLAKLEGPTIPANTEGGSHGPDYDEINAQLAGNNF